MEIRGSVGYLVFFLDGVESTRKLSQVSATDPCERIETRFDLEGGSWVKTIKNFQRVPVGTGDRAED